MRRWLLAAVVVSSSCASVPIKKADAIALADADARVREGCYDCLIEARDTYVRVAVGKARPLVVQRLFEAELLLSLREKELALESSESIGRARGLAKELPEGIDGSRYLAIVEAVPPDATGSTDKEASAFRSAHQSVAAHVDEDLTWLATGPLSWPVRQYLSFALDCGYQARPVPRPPGTLGTGGIVGSGSIPASRLDPSRTAPEGAPPLVVFRAALCGGLAAKPFELVRAEVPRFVETSYFLGRIGYLAALVKGPGKVRPLLTEAYARAFRRRRPSRTLGQLLPARRRLYLGPSVLRRDARREERARAGHARPHHLSDVPETARRGDCHGHADDRLVHESDRGVLLACDEPAHAAAARRGPIR